MKFQAKTMVNRVGSVGGGGSYHREHTMKLNATLRKMAERLPSEPLKKKGPRKYGSPPTKLTNDQVREVRRHFELHMWSREKLCLAYGLTRAYLAQLLSYQVRSKVLP